MPLFEFVCSRCRKRFEELCGSGVETAACPSCGGQSRRVFSTFRTGRGSNAAAGSTGSSGGCGG